MLSKSTKSTMPPSTLLRDRGRFVLGALLVVVVLAVYFVGSNGIHAGSGIDGLQSVLGTKVKDNEGFTLIAPTYKRVKLLPKFLDNYANGKIPSLRKVILIWTDTETAPPASLLDSFASYKVPVTLERAEINSQNQRFHPRANITTDCVLSVDDDMRYAAQDVELGYQVWKELAHGKQRMVGFVPRDVSSDGSYVAGKLKTYRMVLTKGAFLHHDWMKAYWSSNAQMTALRAYVDAHHNCEDILMSFLVASNTRLAPIHVKGSVRDAGTWGGISAASGHASHRTACVRHFLDVFGHDTLIPSSLSVQRI